MGWEAWSYTVLLFIVGALFGSFFNVVGLRVPKGVSVVSPRSSCGSCGRQLNAIDLIPILGWFIRRGKCHTCGAHISPVYMVGELAGGILFAVLPFLISVDELWIAYPLVSVLLILTVSDLAYMLLPNKIIYPAMLLFTGLRLFVTSPPNLALCIGFCSWRGHTDHRFFGGNLDGEAGYGLWGYSIDGFSRTRNGNKACAVMHLSVGAARKRHRYGSYCLR